ncbi:hypothetical protein BH11PSE7_BH11PSE7_13850 [soil metagenome]
MPAITHDAAGGVGLALVVDGVAVTVSHHLAHFPDHVFVVVAFGPVPASIEADVFRELLDANLLMLRPGSPSFGRDPRDGQVVLHACCRMSETNGNALLDGIRVAVARAAEWRRVHRLVPVRNEGAHAVHVSPFAMTAFA